MLAALLLCCDCVLRIFLGWSTVCDCGIRQMFVVLDVLGNSDIKGKKASKDRELIQPSTTPVQGYKIGK